MISKASQVGLALLASAALVGSAVAADLTKGMKHGAPKIKSAGSLAFGPQGILFLADPQSATIFAIDTEDRSKGASAGKLSVEGLNEKVASLLGTDAKGAQIVDLAVNPASGTAYLSVARGRGPSAKAVLVRVTGDGKVAEVPLDSVRYSTAKLDNAPGPNDKDRRNRSKRRESITDLAYVDGALLVAGLSNEEFASKLRSIPVPFAKTDNGTSVEIFHGAHGRFETNSPVRTFAPFKIEGQQHLLAAYTCTPLVKFPLSQLKAGAKIQGTTVAELGNRNRPLDMIVYKKGGEDFVLMANSARGIMKISTEGIASREPITKKVQDKKGQTYETIGDWKGIVQLDRLDDGHALVVVQNDSGRQDLRTLALP